MLSTHVNANLEPWQHLQNPTQGSVKDSENRREKKPYLAQGLHEGGDLPKRKLIDCTFNRMPECRLRKFDDRV